MRCWVTHEPVAGAQTQFPTRNDVVMTPPLRLYRVTDTIRVAGAAARGVARSGLIRPTSPIATLKLTTDLLRWGTSPGIGFSVGAARHPSDIAVIDVDDPDRPTTTFAEIEYRCNTLALSLLDRGIDDGSRVGILGRNSRAFLETLVAVSRTGADLIYLNTSSSTEAIATIAAEQKLRLIFRDQEFANMMPSGIPTITLDGKSGVALLASLPHKGELPTLPNRGSHVILTSGTTSGKSRGAGRSSVPLDAAVAILDAFPIKMGSTILMAAPMFHAWGWMHHRLATLLDATIIVVRKPDPRRLIQLIDEYNVDTLITVPVILRRMVEVPRQVRKRYDTSSLECVAVSGSALPGELALEFMDSFGDVLYNLYGSTEAAFATCASPADLRANPDSAGRPLAGVHIEILDRRGRTVSQGTEGRVYVGSRATFTGYTDGTGGERVRGLVFTGDIGRIDDAGRLTIVGRADDMIITGGENVHPAEVEEVLRTNPRVRDVAVLGVPDPVYGAVLVAHIVPTNPKTANEEAILSWSKTRLGPHHRPRRVVFHDELPRNATGKVLNRVLAGEDTSPEAEDDELG